MEKFSFEQAHDEALKMQEKIKTGEASSFSEAEAQIESSDEGGKNLCLARIIESRQMPDLGEFDEKIKDKLISMANDVIVGVNEASGKELNWTLEFFNPRSVKELNEIRKRRYERGRKHGALNSESSEMKAMKAAGLKFGGKNATDEEVDKAIYFVADLLLAKDGVLKEYAEGSANLTLNKTFQVAITTDGYIPKFQSKIESDDVIKFLQEQDL